MIRQVILSDTELKDVLGKHIGVDSMRIKRCSRGGMLGLGRFTVEYE